MNEPSHEPRPVVQPLSRNHRRTFFGLLLFVFLVAVPLFVFYATGYRYDFLAPDAMLTATGGIYLTVGADDGEVFIDEEPVTSMRIFRSAMYIQSLVPGMHRVHVQAPGLHTWVKELPVYPHIVTEVESFLLPVQPQVRPIAPFLSPTGIAVYPGSDVDATSTWPYARASSTASVLAATTTSTSSLVANPEFDVVQALFDSMASSSVSLLGRITDTVTNAFLFADPNAPAATTTATTSTTTATTTIERSNMRLHEREEDVFVTFTGPGRDIPYYFCVPHTTLASTSELYGAQVMEGIATVLASQEEVSETLIPGRTCRSEIRIDRQGQTVYSFNFFPDTTDLVIMHRADGVFVTEVDDRSWQNTQKVYGDTADAVIVDNGRIYIKDDIYYFELLTEIAP